MLPRTPVLALGSLLLCMLAPATSCQREDAKGTQAHATELFHANDGVRRVGVRALGPDGAVLQQGAGVLLDNSVLVTASHVIRRCSALWIIDDAGNEFVSPASPTASDHDVVMVVVWRGLDAAASPSDAETRSDPDAVTGSALAACVSRAPPAPADRLLVNFGGALVGTEVIATRDSRLFGDHCFDLNLLAHPGQSGSPVLDLDGKLQGVCVSSSPGATIAASIRPSFLPLSELRWRPLSEIASEITTAEEQALMLGTDPETHAEGAAQIGGGAPDLDAQMFLWQHLTRNGRAEAAEELTRELARTAADTLTRARAARQHMGLGKAQGRDDLWTEGLDQLLGTTPWSALVWDTLKVFPTLSDEPELTTWRLTAPQHDWYAADAAAWAGDRQTARDIVLRMDQFWWQFPPPDIDLAGLLGICGLDSADELEAKLKLHPMSTTNKAAGEAVKIWKSSVAFERRDFPEAEELVNSWTSNEPRTEARRRAALASCLWAVGRPEKVKAIIESQIQNGWWNHALARTFAWLADKAYEPRELADLCINPENRWGQDDLFGFGVLVMGNMVPERRLLWMNEIDTRIATLPEGAHRDSMQTVQAEWAGARSALDSGATPDEILGEGH
ncbi:MAG: trypsin-like peptidase domain-containing protein [Phycisphaerales bacterium]|nr:trypsin-like peptidase domain-containing protein [Phycisphaerales bacterium]